MRKKELISFVVYHLKRYSQKGHILLDVGCATAQYRNITDSTYIGMDVTNEDYAQGFPRDIDIIASATDIPINDASCDIVFCVGVLYQIPDYKKALNEFHRVLKPGGRLILFDYNRRTQKRLEKAEGAQRPCWTQGELKSLVQRTGFRKCELLPSLSHELGTIKKWIYLIMRELRGGWAIVTGIK